MIFFFWLVSPFRELSYLSVLQLTKKTKKIGVTIKVYTLFRVDLSSQYHQVYKQKRLKVYYFPHSFVVSIEYLLFVACLNCLAPFTWHFVLDRVNIKLSGLQPACTKFCRAQHIKESRNSKYLL
ncbi:hypothetical protein PHYBLDRAFT_61304 [Phycomyces blakesleeanus NRRL 1555(-)]|uniref:Uncharacterized protein n=1 Tax=Phycomyces blakesleeanus (strain ATCC 8743b / DSM 1359 / FGSC 10004 / NBRC 33097 / NRRL 1555) TaxID=763407 RepID=A0A167N020_PHYB8|nr:hypothetical protein PHYBLDRAFT_61304 [Phycomyces blakesleeanus NRRL 1555(-)]OAD74639.1 hypothetical protein PHYBLDRAFT_61304 [Phycomyces blakesleeanus NRRL 1555(-)]|eukprot:XP_018292679.1 hypothetical protein PHYBLDRAFT_61304 [Phycomyces blakesleeanus NRRL 1555(-)]